MKTVDHKATQGLQETRLNTCNAIKNEGTCSDATGLNTFKAKIDFAGAHDVFGRMDVWGYMCRYCDNYELKAFNDCVPIAEYQQRLYWTWELRQVLKRAT